MKKTLITLIGLFFCIDSFPQLGYRYEDRFIQLTPTTEKRYLVQTRSTDTKVYLQKEVKEKNRGGSNEIEVNQLSENIFLFLPHRVYRKEIMFRNYLLIQRIILTIYYLELFLH